MAEGQRLPEFSRGDVVSKTYEIEHKLGSGMLGATYLAKNLKTKQQVAIKFLQPSLLASSKDADRFDRAFQKAKATKYDGLVRYFETGKHEVSDRGVKMEITWFSQEYFESQSLRGVMAEYQKEQKQFTLQEACQIVIRILESAEYIHKQGTVHKNIKPENVLVQSKKIGPGTGKIVRTIKVTDVGFADIVNPTIFAEGFIPRDEMFYMAPELTAFSEPGTPPSDVYSVGVILYELLVGQTPRGTYLSPTQLRGDLPDKIDDICELAMDANSEGRYPTCQDMLNDIQNSFSGEVFEKSATTSFKNILYGVGVGVAIISVYGIWMAKFHEPPDPTIELHAKDETLRTTLKAQNPPTDQATFDAMTRLHPEMLYVPAGTFLMGRLHAEELTVASQSEPLAKEIKTPSFYIDRFEFPNTLKDPDGNPVKPAAKVTWKQADEACGKLGKRLCTEEEWEKACKGPSNWIYSYGDTFDSEMCGAGMDQQYHLGERQNCVSGYGVYDLSGGLREWTNTLNGPKKNRAVVKGGQRANNEKGSRCAFSLDESVTYADGTLAFRCCLDVAGTGGADGSGSARSGPAGSGAAPGSAGTTP